MFVVHVIPLIRATQLESLTYFSSVEYPIGSFLQVPIRGKQQPAIVTEVKPVSSTKSVLKSATFTLRKLPTQPDLVVLPESICRTADELARVYPATKGAILYQLLPSDIRNGSRPYPKLSSEIAGQEEGIPEILTARMDERHSAYQSVVRSALARHHSTLLVVPTAADIITVKKALSQGIAERVVTLFSQQTKRQRDDAYTKWTTGSVPLLLICTPTFAYIERHDLGQIIIEQAASSHFMMRQRPYLDHRVILKNYAKLSGRAILLGDIVPRTEEEVLRREEIYFTHGEEVKRLAFSSSLTIINQHDKPRPDAAFKLFSDELVHKAERVLEGHGHVFFYAARRGLAPVVACIDCGFIFRCPDSGTPYSLLRTVRNGAEERWFVSSTSGRRVRAADVCGHCGSWRLRERGIGIQHIHDEWKERFPDHSITVLDHTTATTLRQAEKLVSDFYATNGGILLGTQLALPFLRQKVALSAITSLDATRSVPTWRADEQLFRLLLRLREITEKEVLVQTRFETDNLLLYATRGSIERFFDDEISLRSMLNYPPYSQFILLSWQGSEHSLPTLERPIKEILTGLSVQYYNEPNSTIDKTTRYGLIRLVTSENADQATTLTKLRALPAYVKIEIDPERIV